MRIITAVVGILISLLLVTKVNAQTTDVPLDSTNFPDEVFRNYIADEYDIDNDGVLQASEIEAVKSISLSGKGVASVKGIEYFTELDKVFVQENKLTEIDISKNTKLRQLHCYDN